MGSRPGNDKASRYIAQLEEARCAGRWKDVPELCRKVEKHAPHRRCLTLTARSEAQIAAYSNERPSTTASTASTGLSNIVPPLLTAIDEEGDYVEDAFQATICLGWLHYVLDEPGLAVARLPKDISAVARKMSSKETSLSAWSRVCLIKGAYLKGSSQEKTGSVEEAVSTYGSILPWLSSLNSITTETIQFKMWAEHLLVRTCILSDQSVEAGNIVEPTEALHAYRFWGKYWETIAKSTGTEGMIAARYRRLAWKAYYDTLSTILRRSLPYQAESTFLDASGKTALQRQSDSRLQQRAELKRVETVYEGLLLNETQFPKASESNQEIETWTDAVMHNWRFFCGPTWSDQDLGEGGKEAVSRGVLDILYRAATKTFHSTQVLRHLFTVHASLAEFELSFKAYESYVEIITRGKDRVEKTGEEDAGLDNDDLVLQTSAEAIRLLCRFGSRKEAEKAVSIGNHIERWIEQAQHVKATASDAGSVRSVETALAPRSLAVAYSAVGISQAHWARFTYEADARTGIQTKAVQYLRKSLEPRLGGPNSIEALYALALVLAEMRDIPGAIKVVKRALSPATKGKTFTSADGLLSDGLSTEFGRERKLIPLWHLLALLLTSRSDFTTAEKSCEAAFEQFGDPEILFGKEDEDATYKSEHLNEVNGRNGKNLGIVDQMESFEKGGILQMKMTQLALVEVVEGANTAVDGCDELLALYARLFGDSATEQPKIQPPTTTVPPPKSAVGTIRGSIFRSSKGSVRLPPNNAIARKSSTASSRPSTVATQGTVAPTIQVTDENGSGHANGHHRHLFHHKEDDERGSVRRSPSKLRKRSMNSLHRNSEVDGASEMPQIPGTTTNNTSARNGDSRSKSPGRHARSRASSLSQSIDGHERPLHTIAHNLPPSSEPPPAGHSRQLLKQDTRLPASLSSTDYIAPDPRFSKIEERRQRITLLVGIWIFISGLYRRAEMYEDAQGAVNEALKLAETFEGEVAQQSSTSKAFADSGWGCGKSVEELWADAFSARGELLVAQSLQHEARTDFERAVLHFPDHAKAIVGLSNILLDIYTEAIPLEPAQASGTNAHQLLPSTPTAPNTSSNSKKPHLMSHTPSAENQIPPPELNRLMARDRAFGLLSTLTKLGAGWDYSEAWFALARAYEESGQIEKTKEVLWWCVELEDTHPVRSWKSAAIGGFVL
ncbi:filamentation protein-like protein [Pleomassaria siparia CBS 279.74]|uniref:Filamentation protein-like protein n=1 Tax=Pleomassaria siparia CBS 279.74 TaxID=1314801 RepID=A0A6G1KR71_9PLEO|nr:filamentation protein-like protein [Pleomassaria siparia CBS 279.74]